MGNTRNRHPARRRFLKQSAAMSAHVVAQVAALAAPAVVMAKVAGGGEEPVPESQRSSLTRPLRGPPLPGGEGKKAPLPPEEGLG